MFRNNKTNGGLRELGEELDFLCRDDLDGDPMELDTALPFKVDTGTLTIGYCDACSISMTRFNNDYVCPLCGDVQVCNDIETKNYKSGPSSKSSNNAKRGQYYHTPVDNTKQKRQALISQLTELYEASQERQKGGPITMEILLTVADKYLEMQRVITIDERDENDNIISQKPLIFRENNKKMVLAALIDDECRANDVVVKPHIIARFMGLAKNGYADGKNALLRLYAGKNILYKPIESSIKAQSNQYMTALGLTIPKYMAFVSELVQFTEDNHLLMHSHLYSKIAGAMWALIICCDLDISTKDVEAATDNTRKSTFLKFYKYIMDNIDCFKEIFDKYGINTPKTTSVQTTIRVRRKTNPRAARSKSITNPTPPVTGSFGNPTRPT